jgi:hypothetical protein
LLKTPVIVTDRDWPGVDTLGVTDLIVAGGLIVADALFELEKLTPDADVPAIDIR